MFYPKEEIKEFTVGLGRPEFTPVESAVALVEAGSSSF